MRSILLAGSLLLLSPAAAQDAWPQFRGPDSAGISDAAGLPESWSRTANVAWKVPVPGRGWSSPIVWGSRIFLTTAVSEGQEEERKPAMTQDCPWC